MKLSRERGAVSIKIIIFVVVAVFAVIVLIRVLSSVTYATEGTRIMVTKWGRVDRVLAPDDGWQFLMAPGYDVFEINIKSFTQAAEAKVTSKDNAGLQVSVAVTGATSADKSDIAEYFRSFGSSEDERHKRREVILGGIIQTEARNAFAEYGAYEIYANQEAIQKKLFEAISRQAGQQLKVRVESVQLGNPDFLDDRIEQAASSVVANQKAKEASQAAYEAAKIDNERKLLEAQTYANPAAFTIKKMELELERMRMLADGIKGHQGALYLNLGGAGGGLQLQTMVKE